MDSDELISLAEAAAISGFSQDHVGLLARKGLIEARKIGRNWVTTRAAIEAYMRDATKRSRDPLKKRR